MPPWLYSTHSVFISADAGTAANTAATATAAGSRRSMVIEVLPYFANFDLQNFARVSRRALAKSRGFANESHVKPAIPCVLTAGKLVRFKNRPCERGISVVVPAQALRHAHISERVRECWHVL